MGGAVKNVFGGAAKIAAPILKIADPLGIDPSSAVNSKLLSMGGGGGDGMMGNLIKQALAQIATPAAAPADPNLKPFNRPAPTPDLSEGALRDRRRSVGQAMRRRKAASILTGEATGADKLGTG